MLVLVEHDLQPPAEGLSNSAESGKAWDMIAALKARDHRLGHLEPERQLLLRLARMGAQLNQPSCAFGSNCGAVVWCGRLVAGGLHGTT
jgi:hypothetical protein